MFHPGLICRATTLADSRSHLRAWAKGVLGIAVRPASGTLELVSKGTHGKGLVCLGREAITGSTQRRVRAPGALIDEVPEVGSLQFWSVVMSKQPDG